MFKRIVAIILCFCSILGAVGGLTGCSSNNHTISKGEVIEQITDLFGMYNYSSEIPYSETVSPDNPYFQYVQTAFEWNILNDKTINVNDNATKGFLAESLVRCVDLIDATGMSSDEILEYAVQNGYVSFDYRGRTDSIRNVTPEEVSESLTKSFEIWTNRHYEMREEITIGEDVFDFTNKDISLSDIYVDDSTNTVILPADFAENIVQGDTFILPATDSYSTARAYSAENVTAEGGKVIIQTRKAEIDTTIQDLHASGSIIPDFTSGYIIDGAGNIISPEENVVQPSSVDNSNYHISTLAYRDNQNTNISPLTEKGTFALNFNMDGLKITGKVTGNSVSFSVKGDMWTNKDKGFKLAIEKSYEVKDVSLDYDYDIEWFKLKSAYAKVNYTTVDKSSIEFSWKKTGVFAPEYSNGNGHFLSNATRAILKDSQAKGAKTIKICSIPIVSGGVVSFNLDVKIKISISGSVELSVTTDNVKGIEYKNGKVRYIKDEHKDTDLTAKGKAELTLYAGFSFRALSINIIGFGVEGGIGCTISVTAHLADTSNHLIDEVSFEEVNSQIFEDTLPDLNGVAFEHDQLGSINLKCDICTDIVTYGILKFTFDSDSVIGKIVSGTEIKFFDKDNAKIDFLCAHWEDGKKVEKCTLKYVEFEENTDDMDESKGSIIQRTDAIDIDVYFISLNIGETYPLKVEDIPAGYEMTDIKFISADENIATVDGLGNVTAVSAGYVEIRAHTTDKEYSVSCSVYVVENGIEFTPIDLQM